MRSPSPSKRVEREKTMNGRYDFTNYKNDATLLADTVRGELGPRVQGFIDIDEEHCSACGAYTDGDIVVIVECVAQGNLLRDEATNWIRISLAEYDSTNRPDLHDYAYGMKRESIAELCDVEDAEDANAFQLAIHAIENTEDLKSILEKK